jgi:hypothetical protein
LEANLRLDESWLAQALLALWIAAVTLLHYGLGANALLARLP